MRRFIFLTMVGLVIVFASATAQQSTAAQGADVPSKNLIANGGFEEGKDPGGFSTEGKDSKNIAHWTITMGTVDYIGTYFPCHGGKRCIDMDGTPGPGRIQQTFSTTPDVTYHVTFAVGANREGPPNVKKLQVSAAGKSKTFSFDGTKNKGWSVYHWDFAAKSKQTTLTFTSLSQKGNNCGALLDDVSVVMVEK